MSIPLNRVLIISKKDNKYASNLALELNRWFNTHNILSYLGAIKNLEQNVSEFRPDVVLVLGGDGTLLQVTRKLIQKELHFLGINFGRVGFLTEIAPDEWEKRLYEIFIQKKFNISKRVTIECNIIRDGKVFFFGHSINDVVICREGLARLLELSIYIGENEEPLTIRADGVIVSTPNGSTGYCVGAGGSLIFPELNVLQLCPICPFLSLIRPIIIPDELIISVEVNGTIQDAMLTIDGQQGVKLQKYDRVFIKKSKYYLHFLSPIGSSYLKKIKQKGYV